MNINELFEAQLAHVNELASTGHHTYSDDGLDYMTGALSLARDLLMIDNDEIRVAMFENVEDDRFVLNAYACDGICKEIMDAIGEEKVKAWEEL